jgi:membrane protease YdiL (CAAX protease family)
MISYITDLYKKVLRRQIMMEALALLGFYAANFGIVFFITMLKGAITGSTRMSSDFVGLSSIIGIIAGAAVIFMLRGKRLITTDMTHRNEPINGKDFMTIIMLMFALQAALFFVNMLITIITSPIVGDTSSTYESSMNALMTPLGYLYIVLIGPICEEIIFRAGFMRSLERFGANYAIVVSSMFFGLYHIFFNQIPFAFLVGLLLGYTARRFSIWWAILLHIINNGYSVILSLLTSVSQTVTVVVVLCVMLAYIALLVIAIIYLVRNNQKLKDHLSTGKPSSMFHVLGMQHLLAPFGYQAVAAQQYQQSVQQFSYSPEVAFPVASPTPTQPTVAPQYGQLQVQPQVQYQQQQAAQPQPLYQQQQVQPQTQYQQQLQAAQPQPQVQQPQVQQPQMQAQPQYMQQQYSAQPQLQAQVQPQTQAQYATQYAQAQVQHYQQPSQAQTLQPGAVPVSQTPMPQAYYPQSPQFAQQYQTSYQPQMQYQQQQQTAAQAPAQVATQFPAQASAGDINQAFSLHKNTGVSLPPAQPGEPVPHPFRITFTSPFFIATAASLVFFGLLAALTPLFG